MIFVYVVDYRIEEPMEPMELVSWDQSCMVLRVLKDVEFMKCVLKIETFLI